MNIKKKDHRTGLVAGLERIKEKVSEIDKERTEYLHELENDLPWIDFQGSGCYPFKSCTIRDELLKRENGVLTLVVTIKKEGETPFMNDEIKKYLQQYCEGIIVLPAENSKETNQEYDYLITWYKTWDAFTEMIIGLDWDLEYELLKSRRGENE